MNVLKVKNSRLFVFKVSTDKKDESDAHRGREGLEKMKIWRTFHNRCSFPTSFPFPKTIFYLKKKRMLSHS